VLRPEQAEAYPDTVPAAERRHELAAALAKVAEAIGLMKPLL
jgi:hypothetical protein